MICLICRQAEVLDGMTLVLFERNEMQFVIDHVPSRVCPGCGEAYVEERVAEALLQQAVEISETGVLDGVFEYNTLS
jgi:YgiT-type zinc finger domain-containing protein